MEEVLISLTINKWMLYIVVVAIFASFISNVMSIYLHYLKEKIAKAKSSDENSGLNIDSVMRSAFKEAFEYWYNCRSDADMGNWLFGKSKGITP